MLSWANVIDLRGDPILKLMFMLQLEKEMLNIDSFLFYQVNHHVDHDEGWRGLVS